MKKRARRYQESFSHYKLSTENNYQFFLQTHHCGRELVEMTTSRKELLQKPYRGTTYIMPQVKSLFFELYCVFVHPHILRSKI